MRGTRKSDWVQALDACMLPVPTTGCVDGVPLQVDPMFKVLVDNTDMHEHTNHLTVLRVVGDIWVEWVSGLADTGHFGRTSLTLAEGILVMNTDTQGQVLSINPLSNADTEMGWMWRNTRLLQATETMDVDTAGTGVEEKRQRPGVDLRHVDIPVKRVMGERDQLLYIAVALINNTDDTTLENPPIVLLGHNLRTLTRSKG